MTLKWQLRIGESGFHPPPSQPPISPYNGIRWMEFSWDEGYQDLHYFCVLCGSLWASVTREGNARKYALQTVCPAHDWPPYDTSDLPGDLFLPFDSAFNEAIAPAAIPLLNWVWARKSPNLPITNYLIQGSGAYALIHGAYIYDSDDTLAPSAQDSPGWGYGNWKNTLITDDFVVGSLSPTLRDFYGTWARSPSGYAFAPSPLEIPPSARPELGGYDWLRPGSEYAIASDFAREDRPEQGAVHRVRESPRDSGKLSMRSLLERVRAGRRLQPDGFPGDRQPFWSKRNGDESRRRRKAG